MYFTLSSNSNNSTFDCNWPFAVDSTSNVYMFAFRVGIRCLCARVCVALVVDDSVVDVVVCAVQPKNSVISILRHFTFSIFCHHRIQPRHKWWVDVESVEWVSEWVSVWKWYCINACAHITYPSSSSTCQEWLHFLIYTNHLPLNCTHRLRTRVSVSVCTQQPKNATCCSWRSIYGELEPKNDMTWQKRKLTSLTAAAALLHARAYPSHSSFQHALI